jgi:hypothetical protein
VMRMFLANQIPNPHVHRRHSWWRHLLHSAAIAQPQQPQQCGSVQCAVCSVSVQCEACATMDHERHEAEAAGSYTAMGQRATATVSARVTQSRKAKLGMAEGGVASFVGFLVRGVVLYVHDTQHAWL